MIRGQMMETSANFGEAAEKSTMGQGEAMAELMDQGEATKMIIGRTT